MDRWEQELRDETQYNEMDSVNVRGRNVIRAASWAVEAQEAVAAYRVDTRINSAKIINNDAVDAICDLDDYITTRARGRHPAVVAGLRALQDVTAECAVRLLIQYMSRPL